MIARTNLDGSREAVFSECGWYRYTLLITWNSRLPVQANIGLNPSTADELKNDPTVHRDIERAARAGFGSLLKLNAFAFRATDPAEMKRAEDPYGEWRGAAAIMQSIRAHGAIQVVATWGNHGAHLNRSTELRQAAAEAEISLSAYAVNGTGEPTHPLYLPLAASLLVYSDQSHWHRRWMESRWLEVAKERDV